MYMQGSNPSRAAAAVAASVQQWSQYTGDGAAYDGGVAAAHSLARKARIDAVAAWQHAEPPCRHTSSTAAVHNTAQCVRRLLWAK